MKHYLTISAALAAMILAGCGDGKESVQEQAYVQPQQTEVKETNASVAPQEISAEVNVTRHSPHDTAPSTEQNLSASEADILKEVDRVQDKMLNEIEALTHTKEMNFDYIFNDINTTQKDDSNKTVKQGRNKDIFEGLKETDEIFNTKGERVDPLTGAPLDVEENKRPQQTIQVMEFDDKNQPVIRSVEDSKRILQELKEKNVSGEIK